MLPQFLNLFCEGERIDTGCSERISGYFTGGVQYKKNLNLILVEVVGKYLLFNLLVNTREEQTKCKSCAIGKTFKVRNNVPKVFVGRFLWL